LFLLISLEMVDLQRQLFLVIWVQLSPAFIRLEI
jgi:hypothetical protein